MTDEAPYQELVTQDLLEILALGGTVTLIEDAAQTLEAIRLEQSELHALSLLPLEHQLAIKARLLEVTEMIREHLRDLDAANLILQLGEQSD